MAQDVYVHVHVHVHVHVQDVVHIVSLFDESVSACGGASGVLRVFWDATPPETRCQKCRKELLAIADNIRKMAGE